jgi:glyoxalase family protein
MELEGLHHLTAVTGDPSVNVGFYTEVLGLRLVKKTVNQDDLSAYHLFYGDEAGNPGTEVTFFDWPHAGPTARGAGTITATALRVPGHAALEAWARRLSEFGVRHEGIAEHSGRASIAFTDTEGQRLELVDDGGKPGGTPWSNSPVPENMGIRGLHAVHIPVRRPDATTRLLTGVLGFGRAEEYGLPDGTIVHVFEMGPGGPGTEIHLEERPELAFGRVGIGGVHHVAFRTPNGKEQLAWQRRLSEWGVGVTPVIDRYYFKSVYFREPGGVLFEIATDGPGFATDEPREHLGESLSLPPFLESKRARIEAGLRPINPVRMEALRAQLAGAPRS